MEDIKTAMQLGADYVAVSFPKNATDMEMARQLCNVACADTGHRPGLIAKIERAEAVPKLEEILKASDGIMVARGDLAVEVGHAAVPALQKKMIRLARDMDKVVITATQMMESMITNPVPTRAEVSDVANAVLDGTDAVMLSAETAVGKYPLETVREMAKICAAAEAAEDRGQDGHFNEREFTRIDQAIAQGALFTAHKLGAKAIVAMTESGSTALWMSRHRVHTPIYALTPKVGTQRKMALYRNVRPCSWPPAPSATRRWCRPRAICACAASSNLAMSTPSPAASPWASPAAPICCRSARCSKPQDGCFGRLAPSVATGESPLPMPRPRGRLKSKLPRGYSRAALFFVQPYWTTTMPLISMREMLDHAAENGYGIPAFNVNNLEQVQAVMSAADEVGAP